MRLHNVGLVKSVFDQIVRDLIQRGSVAPARVGERAHPTLDPKMLHILGSSIRSCDGIARRELLQAGVAGLLGMSLPKLLAAEVIQTPQAARARSVLFVFLYGGPSQLETFDMKPDAPSGIRGPFRPISARSVK